MLEQDDWSEGSEDEELFAALVDLVPRQQVESAVQAFFRKHAARETNHAFANPDEWLAGATPEQLDDETKRQLREDVQRLASQPLTQPSPELLAEEAVYLQDELWRHWLDMGTLALDHVAKQQRHVLLDKNLHPVWSEASGPKEWEDARRDSIQSLLRNAAIVGDDIPRIAQLYFDALRKRLRQGPMRAPGSLQYALRGPEIALHLQRQS